MQKCVNLVDLVKSFPTSIYSKNVASIQARTSLSKFAKKREEGTESAGRPRARTERWGRAYKMKIVWRDAAENGAHSKPRRSAAAPQRRRRR